MYSSWQGLVYLKLRTLCVVEAVDCGADFWVVEFRRLSKNDEVYSEVSEATAESNARSPSLGCELIHLFITS
uniref:Uncharacterized protein n=1 Tax=Cyanothece sp. (strain PCC 7425 / ATCC 29141) TaxID=395961 RepID=B8HTE0_CYAP4